MRTRSSRNSGSRSDVKRFSEHAIHRVRTAAAESIRYNLFALRCEILWSSARILKVINSRKEDSKMIFNNCEDDNHTRNGISIITNNNSLNSKSYPIIFNSPFIGSGVTFSDFNRLTMASYWASELCLALADGLTIRALKVERNIGLTKF